MSKHPSAVEHLVDFRNQIAQPWFTEACRLACTSTGTPPTASEVKALADGFESGGPASVAAATSTVPVAKPAASVGNVKLAQLRSFKGFKRLSNTVSIGFAKPLTIVFGTNGSGKSSICAALRVLASPERPVRPLFNARGNSKVPGTFEFQFAGQPTPAVWTESVGYGAYSAHMKYFDSTVAHRNTTTSVSPSVLVELAPFRTEVFEYCRALVLATQTELRGRLVRAENDVDGQIALLRARLGATLDLKWPPIAALSNSNAKEMAAWLPGQLPFDGTAIRRLADAEQLVEALTKSSSAAGVAGLEGEVHLLGALQGQIQPFLVSCRKIDLRALAEADRVRSQKMNALQVLSAQVFPSSANHGHFDSMLVAANAVQDFGHHKSTQQACQLCRRPHDASTLSHFAAYHRYLTNNLRQEIADVDAQVQAGRRAIAAIQTTQLQQVDGCVNLLAPGKLEDIKSLIAWIISILPKAADMIPAGGVQQLQEGIVLLANALALVVSAIQTRSEALTSAKSGAKAIADRLAKARAEVGQLKVDQALWTESVQLSAAVQSIEQLQHARARLTAADFTSLLRRLTVTAKNAYADLVVGTFEARLDDEYRAISGQSFVDLGVQLARVGDEQDVVLEPRVASVPLERVLSEGEAKVHALALFFAEAKATSPSILVLDDPATSFDYNNISRLSERVRDVIRDSAGSQQVIVLTHNWDFFVNLQTVMARSRLDPSMSVLVMENCDLVKEYTEKRDLLIQEVRQGLAQPGEPSTAQKEALAGTLRRLAESVVNTRVFNGQRHQYKQKTVQISTFHEFRYVTPLTTSEADSLRDLYASLSTADHDDPRNSYVAQPKAVFQRWFDQLTQIDSAVEARRPK